MKRTALITGASRGLGATLARLLAGHGFDLVVSARTPHDLELLADELRSERATVLARHGDLADPFTWHTLVDAARYIGGLDLLVNNASILGSSRGPSPDGLAPLADVDASQLERVLRVNVVAPLALTSAALPLLARKRGLVVNLTSDAAYGAYPGWGAYGASKAALDLATRTLASELAPQGIAVVSVDPGDMRTRMHQEAFPAEDISDRPLPDVTVPFWQWLLEQDGQVITGRRFRAQTVREQWAASA